MKNKTLRKLINIEFLIIGMTIGMVLTAAIIIYSNKINNTPLLQVNFKKDSNCNNLSLIDSSYCLREQLSSFYKYNFSQVSKELSLEQFKSEGGVCSHATDWFKERANELGFKFKEVTVETGRTYDHQFGVISNTEGYCLLDQQMIPQCVLFNNATTEELT